jgi:predicted nuclease of predicted toxin-antitoxin system
MRLKIDENLHPDVATYLRGQGHDAATVWDESLRGTADSNLAQVCQQEGRALITMDLDFADIRSYPPEQYPGLIVLRLASQSRAHVMRSVARIEDMLREEKVAGKLLVVDETSVRLRGREGG